MYKVYLGDILLPIAPQKIELKYSNKNKTVTLIDSSEINIIKPSGLTEISFDVLLPNQDYPFAEYEDGFVDAGTFLEKIRNLKVEKKFFLLKIIRTLPRGKVLFYNEDFKATIEDLTYSEDAKEGFDVTAKLKLKQYVEFGTQIYTEVAQSLVDVMTQRALSEAKAETVPSEDNPQTYTVKSGDTLWMIAKKMYGDGSKYKDIATLNGISNPNFIKVGQVLKLG